MYHWDAADYHQHSAMQLGFAHDLLRDLTLRGDERVLDLGCGDGKITAQIAARLPHGAALGVDVSEAMVAFAQQTFAREAYPNLSFAVADASRLTYEREFDVVVSFSALHWVRDHVPVLAGITRALKPSGKLLMQFGGKGNMGALDEIAREIPHEPLWRGAFADFIYPWSFYSADEYRCWLERAHLTPRRVVLAPKDATHRGRAGFQAWIRTAWPPYMQCLPERLRQEFLDELTDRYLTVCPIGADGLVHVPMVRLEVEAEKCDEVRA